MQHRKYVTFRSAWLLSWPFIAEKLGTGRKVHTKESDVNIRLLEVLPQYTDAAYTRLHLNLSLSVIDVQNKEK